MTKTITERIIEIMDNKSTSYQFVQHTFSGRYEDRITVTRSRSIGLPKGFFDDNKVGDYQYAALYYDKQNMAIGIVFTNEHEPGSIKITRNNKGYGGQIPAISFFKANRINTKKFAGRYEYEKKKLSDLGFSKLGEMYIVNLEERSDANESTG